MISYTSVHVAVLCAWCKKLMREGKGPASHSICTDCAKLHFPEEV